MSSPLLDTQLLIRSAKDDPRLPALARLLIDDPTHAVAFSAASIREAAIEAGLGRQDFALDPRRLRRGLLDSGYRERPVTAGHGIAFARLPPIHRALFDHILVAQADVEGATLLTADRTVARYPGPGRLVAASWSGSDAWYPCVGRLRAQPV